MEFWLPIIYVAIMGLALLIYVVLEKDIMIASIGPFWDANETWIVLGVGVLLIAFPMAHGAILTALYIPVTLMLMGLILRGVAFDLRVKAGDHRKQLWNRAFFLGSLVAAVSQGWMLGAYVTGLRGDLTSHLFALLIGLTLPAFYLLLGSTWLLMKTEGALFDKALRWAGSAGGVGSHADCQRGYRRQMVHAAEFHRTVADSSVLPGALRGHRMAPAA